LKYSVNDDISIFIANLQNLINDLEDIDGALSSKIGILNRFLPPDLRWINVFQFDDWNKCATYVKRVIPGITLSNLKENTNITPQTLPLHSMPI